MRDGDIPERQEPPRPTPVAVRIEPWRILVATAAIVLGLAVTFGLHSHGIGTRAAMALGLTVSAIVLWATVAIPQPVTGLAMLAIAWASGTASFAAVVSGYMSSTIWLVFGGILLGLAAERSGFGQWIARRFLGGFRTSFSGLLFGVLLGTTILSFFVPANMGRLAITVPIVLALAKDAGYAPGTPGYIALVLTAVVGNFTIALAILPANLMNMMVVGTGELLYGIRISYVEYLWLCGPVLGVVKAALTFFVLRLMFRAPDPAALGDHESAPVLSPQAQRVAGILALAIALWATDVWHGLPPGIVALIAGALCFVPGVGVLDWREAFNPQRWLMVAWVGSVLGLGGILIESGASTLMSGTIARLAGVEGQSPTYGYFAIAYSASILTAIATIGGAMPIIVAAAGDVARATGLPLQTAVLSVTAGNSALFLPFVAVPLVVGLSLGRVAPRQAAPFMIVLAFATWAVVVPLNALWWRIVGALP